MRLGVATLRSLSIAMMIGCGGCAARYVASPGSTTIAPGLQFAIPTGRELGYSVDSTQLITAHVRDQVQVFQAYVSATPDKVTIIAFDPFGGRALTVIATDDAIHTEVAPIVPAVLRPGNILADLRIVSARHRSVCIPRSRRSCRRCCGRETFWPLSQSCIGPLRRFDAVWRALPRRCMTMIASAASPIMGAKWST